MHSKYFMRAKYPSRLLDNLVPSAGYEASFSTIVDYYMRTLIQRRTAAYVGALAGQWGVYACGTGN